MTSSELLSIPENQCPPGAEATVISNGKIELRVARWLKLEGGEPKGTVILAHGRTEFIEKYYEVIGDLLDRGLAVLTFDWRGQGLATRELEEWQRGHIENYDEFLKDLDCIFASDFAKAMPGPRYVLSHSMGCNIMLRYLHDHPEIARRAVFSSPMLAIGSGAMKPVMQILTAGADALGRGDGEPFISKPVNPCDEPFEGNPVTSDEIRFARTKATVAAQPRLAVAGLSWKWIKAALASVEIIWTEAFMAELQTPILFVAAGQEKLVDPGAATRYAAAAKTCEAVTIEGSLHEILMEKGHFRRQFYALMDEFLARG